MTTISATPDVVPVSPDAQQRINSALASSKSASTLRNYKTQWQQWQMFCSDNGYPSMPAAPEHLADWITSRADRGMKVSSIKVGLAAVGFVHKISDAGQPHQSPLVSTTMAGISRIKSEAQSQASALTADALAAITATARMPRRGRGRGGGIETEASANWRGSVDIALVSVMSDAGLRRSEAAALVWADVEQWADGSGRITIRQSKTDINASGAVAAVRASTMAALNTIRPVDVDVSSSVFNLSDKQIHRRIRAAAEAAGLGSSFGGHSGRVGMARRMVANGAPTSTVQNAGRWKTPRMVAHYTRGESAGEALKYL